MNKTENNKSLLFIISIVLILSAFSVLLINTNHKTKEISIEKRGVQKPSSFTTYKKLGTLTSDNFNKVLTISTEVTSNDDNDVQSFTKAGNYYIFASIKGNSKSRLSIYRTDTKKWTYSPSSSSSTLSTLCHANGMTFNSNTNEIIITRGNCPSGAKDGYYGRKISKSSLPSPVSSDFSYGNIGFGPDKNYKSTAITYDSVSNKNVVGYASNYGYVGSTTTKTRYGQTFCNINYPNHKWYSTTTDNSTYSTDATDSSLYKCDFQDFNAYNGYLLQARVVKKGADGSRTVVRNYIDIYGIEDGKYYGSYEINIGNNLYELESAYYVNNKLELLFNYIRNIGGYLYRSNSTLDLFTIYDYTVSYDANGGTGAPNAQTITTESNLTISPTVPTRTGYVFKEWNTREDGTGTSYRPSALYTGKTSMKLYAQWKGNTLYAKYHMNGGTMSSDHGSTIGVSGNYATVNESQLFKIAEYGGATSTAGLADYNNENYINIIKTGYTAKSGSEWNTKADGTGTSYNQAVQYQASDFANLSSSDQTIELFVNWEPISYTITYNLEGGQETSNPTSYNIETNTFTLNQPIKEGYIFTGWTGSNGTTPQKNVTITKGTTNHKTYTANWERIEYTITYDLNGGTVSSNPVSYNIKSSNITLNQPTKEGYTFTGWTGSNGQIEQKTVVITQGSIGNKSYVAHYSSNSYTISFNSNGGTSVSSITKAYNEAVSSPINPTKTGYTFVGWYRDESLTNQYSFTTMPAEDITLYAKWTINKYTIHFNSLGGSQISDIEKNYGEAIIAPTKPIKEGYKFAGWYTDSSTNNLYVFTTMPAEDITLYAKWIENENIINYESNGGVIDQDSPTTYITGTEVQLKAATKEGYTFKGWYLNANLTNKITKITEDMNSDITLYAGWIVNEYTISFNSNGGSSVSSITKAYNETIPQPANPTKEGYEFLGWYSNQELTNLYSFTTMPARNITLFAKWNSNIVTVVFETNGGSSIGSIQIQKGNKINNIPTPQKTGYTFIGWFKDMALNNSFDNNETISNDMILYAKWSINKYTVSFESNSGQNISSQEVTYNGKVNEPEIRAKEGYTFGGWYKDTLFTTPYNFNTGVDHNFTLYAKWTAKLYTISFDSNGGSSVSSITTSYNSPVHSPSNPAKLGYTFAGWYSDKSLTNLYSFTTMPSENITLYAKWASNENVITYVTNGGTNDPNNITTFRTGQTFELKNPTREGYVFKGWYKEPNFINQIAEITEAMTGNITLHAKWNIKTVTIKYMVDGYIIEEKESQYGKQLILPTPTKTGYSFNGWYTNEEMTNQFDTSTEVKEDLELYGNFVLNEYTIFFNSNGGSNVINIIAQYGERIIEPNSPVKDGYKFAGWYSDKALTKLYSFTTMPAKNITLYAKWVSNNKVVVKYVLNGGINNRNNVTSYNPGEDTKLLIPVRKGYIFKGWYLDSKYTKRITNLPTDVTSDITLYARWEKEINASPNTTNKTFIIIIIMFILIVITIGNNKILKKYYTN